jgi:thioredoxin reductase (NADPH)
VPRLVIDTDVVIIGAGPVGLFALFQLGLQGLSAHVIDALPEAGGQCVALYPHKPIYDVPGVPVCTGLELTEQLLAQAEPFVQRDPRGRITNVHLKQLVSSVSPLTGDDAGPGFKVETSLGQSIHCRAVFVAAGAGAFVPRTLGIASLDGAPNVHYDLAPSSTWAGQHVVVAGGGEEAVEAVVTLALRPEGVRPACVSLMHRRDHFQTSPELEAQLRELIAQGRVRLALGVIQSVQHDADVSAVSTLTLLGADGQAHELPVDHLLVRLGLSPKLGALSTWGMALDRKQVSVSSDCFESSQAGIYAVGDINTYPGKKRLLLCGFHEATLAAHAVAASLHPEAPQHLQYTTTSTLLLQRLGKLKA